MSELTNDTNTDERPGDLKSCWAIIDAQRATIAAHTRQLEALTAEYDKLRKMIQHALNGHRSGQRVLADPNQDWLPFENSAEYQEARAEAEAEAEAQAIVERYKGQRSSRPRKPRGNLPGRRPPA